jgi:hypothetical protein
LVGAKKQGGCRDFIGGLPAPLKNGVKEAGELLLGRHAHAFGEGSAEIL